MTSLLWISQPLSFRVGQGICCVLVCALLSLHIFVAPAYAASTLEKAHKQAQLLIAEGQSSQQRIDQSLATSQALDEEFKQLSKALEQIKINLLHQQQLQKQQTYQLSSLNRQLDSVAKTEHNLIPLMLNMIDWLAKQIEADPPFHLTERRHRIEQLKRNILSPQQSLAEIYQSILDAYEVERDFGYSIESYQQNIELNGKQIDSQILRIGRIGLYYLTLDHSQGGVWSRQTRQWQTADAAVLKTIQEGILIARKQRPHSLLRLPLSVGVEPR